ncbi:Aldehyde oxidase and xanthine dehydrogenase, a/b hammerhead domain protein [Acididesulfobacillus acetoxydans]|uniref:4-hydroxybenzoyl-CoA reductase subunit alpha n=1 Tax=Acididesulfobacillus acetoxydans TaxID=1561005 RepID=A0A8S0X4W5_9FIRM|nr:molybdopterin cofactor-binding domain-containing protein [Acididesulfobacillus acetoxydans]CAA7601140.1 Aldehyde oxidase and xanthine dehydrogenase, a/b hammerhead domain protein [Acididesulfobacillus acetoxydans]CEJ08581.1 4-hydroxybenzoyl-CoA reductase subunit alpha [Acididesulfobacillus acetoxydans]
MKDLTVVGKSLPRVDAPAKVRGEALYSDDLVLPHMAFGKIKRSPHAHALITSIHYERALALPGVLAVITGEDAPTAYGIVPQAPTEYALAVDKVRYAGEGVAAVAAVDEETAEEALERIEVEYEVLPAVFDPLEAMERPDVVIHAKAKNNVMYEGKQEFGDVDKAMAASDFVLERRFKTSYVNHAFLEPHSALAHFDANGFLTVYSSTQIPHYLHRTLSLVLALPMNRIRVSVPAVGGGFGGKGEVASSELCAALLARKTGRPVKVTYERSEVFAQHKGRHPCVMEMKIGVSREGIIQAVDFDNILDGGAYGGWGIIVLFYTAAMIHLPYKVPNARFHGRRVYTNKPTTGAMRGLGGVQPRFAMESMLEDIAKELGMSPYDLRLRNAVESGYTTRSNVYVPQAEFKKCLETAAERSGYLEKQGKLPPGRGIGMAGGYYISGTAYTLYMSYKPHSSALIRVDTEGGITLYTGATDIGQGSNTVLPMIAAEELGVEASEVHIISGDTQLTPFDLGSFASRVTYGAGQAVRSAAQAINRKLYEVAAVELGVRADQLISREGRIFSRYEPVRTLDFTAAVAKYIDARGPLSAMGHYSPPRKGMKGVQGANIGQSPTFGFSAQVTEVEVDLETGQVKVLKVTEAGDCGQPINPMSVEGQVEGSIVMGMGQALFEEIKVGSDGRLLNPSLHDYKIPTAIDIPEIDSTIVESYDPSAPFGAKESGEGPIQPVIPAIANAICDAIGVRFLELPITAEKILQALKDKNSGKSVSL